jgi:SAM-dependent methyltransferase
MEVTSKSVARFLREIRPEFRHRFLNELDPGRVIALMQFNDFLTNLPKRTERIAVVSGSLSEPELCLVRSNAKVTLLNFVDNPNLFDLNKDWTLPDWSEYQNTFDLVMCEQVLEHLLHPQRALKNLSAILKPGGLLHITVPAINNSHGAPQYFYAGFPAQTLVEFARSADLTVLESSSWMSDKGARMYSTCNWAPISHSGSISLMILGLRASRSVGRGGAFLSILLGRVKNFATYPFQRLLTPKPTINAVTTWLWAEKSSH